MNDLDTARYRQSWEDHSLPPLLAFHGLEYLSLAYNKQVVLTECPVL
jgi:hypothetical protein